MNPSMSSAFVFAASASLWEICDFAPEDKHKSEQTMAAEIAKQRNVRKGAKVSKVISLSQ